MTIESRQTLFTAYIIFIQAWILHKFITFLIHTVISEVHVATFSVFVLVLLSGKASEALVE